MGEKISHKFCSHLFCHMLLYMEGVSSPSCVNKEAFTVALAHLLKATPSERCCVLCQLASGSPNCATRSQFKEVRLYLVRKLNNEVTTRLAECLRMEPPSSSSSRTLFTSLFFF